MTLKTIGRRYPVFIAVVTLCALYLLSDPYENYQVLNGVLALLSKFEAVKAHEIILLALLLILGVAIDQTRNAVRYRSQRRLDGARLQVVKSTMATVQDIVNNALNNLIFIHIEAEKSQALSQETLRTFENIITETAERLREINELEILEERNLGNQIHSLDLENARVEQNGLE